MLRDKIWKWVSRNIPENQILPLWAFRIRAILYPANFFAWYYGSKMGYDFCNDSYNFLNVRVYREDLKLLTKPGIYRIDLEDDRLLIKEVHNDK